MMIQAIVIRRKLRRILYGVNVGDYQVFTAATLQIAVFQVLTPGGLVKPTPTFPINITP
jgi:hypothetical protein